MAAGAGRAGCDGGRRVQAGQDEKGAAGTECGDYGDTGQPSTAAGPARHGDPLGDHGFGGSVVHHGEAFVQTGAGIRSGVTAAKKAAMFERTGSAQSGGISGQAGRARASGQSRAASARA